jgi:excinuclease ABC subunit C
VDDYISEIESYLALFYQKNEVPKEIIISSELDKDNLSKILNTNVIYSIKGTKKSLLDLVKSNAKIALKNEFEQIKQDETRTIKANEELRKLLNLKSLYRIDIYDNSNLFGEYSVSGMVVYKNGKPSKNDYRKFKISMDKNDDYNTMKEVLYRRYYRVLIENLERPDLIIVDGGANQINAAKEIIDSLKLNIKIVGLAKDNKHRTNELIDEDLKVIKIDKTSNLFHLLTRMQDEVHRFTINYHREIRSKGSISSILDNIEGLGTKRKKALIKHFGSVKKIKSATIEELKDIIPEKIAINLKEYLEVYMKDKSN